MRPIYNSILETIGNTPIVRLHSVVPKNSIHEYYAKLEYFNPGMSVKDRIALALIEGAEKSGKLKPGGTIIEATSGNTGMGLALVAAVKGYRAIFIMPDKISEEKRAVLRAYGAKVVITPTAVEPEDPRSYISVARKLVEITPNSFLTNQYHNPDNPRQHYETTGPEIWEQMGGKIDAFFAGAGTGGTISGVGKFLKEKNPKIQIVCPDPVGSILYDLFYHKKVMNPPQPYKVEGVGEDMLPENVHMDVIDGFIQVSDKESFMMTREIVASEAICVGPSSAMNLVGAVKYAEANFKTPHKILVLMPDSGRSYLSKAFSDNWMKDNEFLPSPMKTLKVADLLKNRKQNETLISASVDQSVIEVVNLLKKHAISQVPVFSGEQLVGLLDETDLLLPLATGSLKANEPIIHLIKGSVIWVQLEDNLQSLAEHFQKGYVALVRDQNEKLKILTRIDLLDYLGSDQ